MSLNFPGSVALAVAAYFYLLAVPRTLAQQPWFRQRDEDALRSRPASFGIPSVAPHQEKNAAEKVAPPATDDEWAKFPKDEVFRLESEYVFRERLRREFPTVKNVQFPADVLVHVRATTADLLAPRVVEPVFAPVCYRPLYFEDPRTERFGHYVPYLQPLISTSKFYLNVLELPCRMIAAPPWTYECGSTMPSTSFGVLFVQAGD
jgi:hypothetical protein